MDDRGWFLERIGGIRDILDSPNSSFVRPQNRASGTDLKKRIDYLSDYEGLTPEEIAKDVGGNAENIRRYIAAKNPKQPSGLEKAESFAAGFAGRLGGGVARGVAREAATLLDLPGTENLIPGARNIEKKVQGGLRGFADEMDRREAANLLLEKDQSMVGKGQTTGTVAKGIFDTAAMVLPSAAVTKAVPVAGKASTATRIGQRVLAEGAGSLTAGGVEMLEDVGRGDKADPLRSLGVGLALDISTLGAGKLLGHIRKVSQAKKLISQAVDNGSVAQDALRPITDATRMLPDGSQSRIARISEIDSQLDEVRQGRVNITTYNKNLPNMEGTTPNVTTTPRQTQAGLPDRRTAAARRQGVMTPSNTTPVTSVDQLRALVKERDQLVNELDQITNPVVQTVEMSNVADNIEARAATTGNKTQAKLASDARGYVEHKAAVLDNGSRVEQMTPGTPRASTSPNTPAGTAVPRAQEALAEMAQSRMGWSRALFDLEATSNINLANQLDEAINLAETNWDEAVRIGLVEAPPPPGMLPSTMYEVVGQRLLADPRLGDRATRRGLFRQFISNSKVPEMSKQAGQLASGHAVRNADSPVNAIGDLLKERRKYDKLAVVTERESEALIEASMDLAEKRLALDGLEQGSEAFKKAADDWAYSKLTNDFLKNDLIEDSIPSIRSLVKQGRLVKSGLRGLETTASLAKSIKSTMDISSIGRQGWPTMTTHPTVWYRNTLKQFNEIGKAIKDPDALEMAVNADILTRTNSLNGLYKASGLKVYGAVPNYVEEAFPKSFRKVGNSWVGKAASRPFRASEVLFQAFQQRNRADLFDMMLKHAQDAGIDVTDVKFTKQVANRANVLTRSGGLPKELGKDTKKWLNITIYSPEMLSSNFALLGGHVATGAGGVSAGADAGSMWLRKQAAIDLMKMSVSGAGILAAAAYATGGKVDIDPRSSEFGKLKIGETRFDLTGGLTGLFTLGARIATLSTKSSNGEVYKLNDPDASPNDPNRRTALGVIQDFAGNKASPLAGMLLDLAEGRDFDGNRPTAGSIASGLSTPLIVGNIAEAASNPHAANILAITIAEVLGFGTNTYSMETAWSESDRKDVKAFKSSVPDTVFKRASAEYDDSFRSWYEAASNDPVWSRLDQKRRLQKVRSYREQLTKRIITDYGGLPENKTKTDADLQQEALLERLKKYEGR